MQATISVIGLRLHQWWVVQWVNDKMKRNVSMLLVNVYQWCVHVLLKERDETKITESTASNISGCVRTTVHPNASSMPDPLLLLNINLKYIYLVKSCRQALLFTSIFAVTACLFSLVGALNIWWWLLIFYKHFNNFKCEWSKWEKDPKCPQQKTNRSLALCTENNVSFQILFATSASLQNKRFPNWFGQGLLLIRKCYFNHIGFNWNLITLFEISSFEEKKCHL